MPARRLAMRATFRPCSASGIAHPRITSSIWPRSTAGARARAASIAAAARSSGRVPRSRPCGARPTAVRAADTITASLIPVPEKILDGVGHLAHFAVEEMIGGVDDDQLLRVGALCVEALHVLERTDLVAFALDEELRLGARPNRLEVVT